MSLQLICISLYGMNGERRDVEFNPGALNIITGESQTGKSALVAIIEYCLGRDSMRVPVGPISKTVGWYGALWQIGPGERAFSARPAPAPGRGSTQQAVLEFGDETLTSPDLKDLNVNIDSDALRVQLGRRIGIEELVAPPGATGRPMLQPHLGHATWLCLQGQNEIADPTLLFHRQGDQGIAQALKDTLPYFLGAIPVDGAAKRSALRELLRELGKVESELQAATDAASGVELRLRGLADEAHAVGLIPPPSITDPRSLIELLRHARIAEAHDAANTGQQQDQLFTLRQKRDDTERKLRALLSDRELLLEQRHSEDQYRTAIEIHAGRLTSLELLPSASEPSGHGDVPGHGNAYCPLCRAELVNPDPSADQIARRLQQLRRELADVQATPPIRTSALNELDTEITDLRREIVQIDKTIAALQAAERSVGPTSVEGKRDFVRGRIDATLERAMQVDELAIARLRVTRDRLTESARLLRIEVEELDERQRLLSILMAVSRDATRFAQSLQLEHSDTGVSLDLSKLTVVVETGEGPIPLWRVGSAANWIGYHLAAHLALHKHFVGKKRPVPHFLVLDQPTQAYYPSEAARLTGIPATDTDAKAVESMYLLMLKVVAELAPDFQIIVLDHADLSQVWFQEAVRHKWRHGVKLIPSDWLAEPLGDEDTPSDATSV